ncbi:hypothetical protein B0J13DRAFT_621863 [Dactylonectria estremocensis]|uniref:Uncharacterized protein n=1 Tax=Dactylonectria estremocensis TaxID=1079267 RepID=A0A9P9EYJ0_9HYPO|nr:hypothetical protein B0J13DRAFT_621863 [Dactylonectria estremocensis]
MGLASQSPLRRVVTHHKDTKSAVLIDDELQPFPGFGSNAIAVWQNAQYPAELVNQDPTGSHWRSSWWTTGPISSRSCPTDLPFRELREEETPLQIMFRPWRYTWSPTFFQVVQMLVDRGADAAGIAQRMSPDNVARFEGYEELWAYIKTAEAGVVNISGY